MRTWETGSNDRERTLYGNCAPCLKRRRRGGLLRASGEGKNDRKREWVRRHQHHA